MTMRMNCAVPSYWTGLLAVLLLSVLCPVRAIAQDLTVTAPAQSQRILIWNATVHTAAGAIYSPGAVVLENGRITEVLELSARGEPAYGADDLFIDATGMHVYPGFIAPHTELGLTEHGAVLATNDMNEVGQITPEVVAAHAVNPDSTLIPVARANGILTFASLPTGGAIPGRASILASEGWTWKDMTIKHDAALVINWPAMRPNQDWFADEPDAEQRDRIRDRLDLIDETFQRAIAYHASASVQPDRPTDIRFESMKPYLPVDNRDPVAPVIIAAEEIDQITAAVVWAKSLGIRPIIMGGRDAHLVTDLLITHDVPVIIDGTHRFPKRSDSPYNDAYALPAKLEAAGVRYCIASADRTGNERNLPYNAAMAAAFGLTPDQALRAITANTAEILELHDLGTLERGKRATLFLADGDALEITTNITRAFIDGRDIDLTNKQTDLGEKYLEKYRQLDMLERGIE